MKARALTLVALCAFGVCAALACSSKPIDVDAPVANAPDRFSDLAKPVDVQSIPAPGATPPGARRANALARFELAAPQRSPFILHGTIPLPPNTLVPDRGTTVFGIVSHAPGNPVVPAQIDVVSRAPDGTPDVIELSAEVELDPAQKPGARVRFDVVPMQADLAPGPSAPSPAMKLFARDGDTPVLLRTRDVFGNVYEVDLRGMRGAPGFGSRRILRNGPARRLMRTHGTLVPVDRSEAGGDPLLHMMGVHAYWTLRTGDERVSLDLRVHNGATSGSRPPHTLELPTGIIYWDRLELVLPEEWTVTPLFQDPFFGKPRVENGQTVVPIVGALPDGELHCMGPQAQFERRLILQPRASAQAHARPRLEGLAFCVEGKDLYSWQNPRTARYFAGRGLLATWGAYSSDGQRGRRALRADLAEESEGYKRVLATGSPNGRDVVASVMGWAHPWFPKAQGTTGGGGIQLYEGERTAAAASVHGYLSSLAVHRMNVCRQSEAAYDAKGDAVGYAQWADEKGNTPFDFRTNGNMVAPGFKLPKDGGPAPSPHVGEVYLRGLRPPYDMGSPHVRGGEMPGRDDNLLSWSPHDGQHMVRYTKNTKALVWLGNDAMAADDLRLSAELFRLMLHEGHHGRAGWTGGVSLAAYERHAREHPHEGAWVGRDQAWGIDAFCAAYSIADPAWRRKSAPWLARVARFLLDAATPGGIIQRNGNSKILGHDRYDAAQTYESLFLLHALRCLRESVLRGVAAELNAELEALYLKTIDYLYFGPIWSELPGRAQGSDKPFSGPRKTFPVALRDGYDAPPFSDTERWGAGYLPEALNGGVETTYGWSALAYAAQLSQKSAGAGRSNRYLRRALKLGTPFGSFRGLLDSLFAGRRGRRPGNNSGNWIDFAAYLQALGI